MSRNKYPEETRNLILDVSAKLFLSQGYEKTSLQDIIDHLGGLTKGAIYHHFKSKEDILLAIVTEITSSHEKIMNEVRFNQTLNGREKLEKMFEISIEHPSQDETFTIMPNMLNNPTLLSYYMKMLIEITIPHHAQPVIEEGIKDGSIHTDKPKTLASALMFLSDVWLNPLVDSIDNQEMYNRAILINEMMQPFGITVFNENSMKRLLVLNDCSK